MEKEFVPYELSGKLKSLGFDEPCMSVYYGDVEDIQFTFNVRETQYYAQKGYKNGVLVPLYQQAFRWFREKYKLSHIWIMDEILDTGNFTYEEAELACLEKLIEIVDREK